MSEWISVKERLPEIGEPILLWPNTVGKVGYGCYFGTKGDWVHWCDWEDHTEPFEPSHWMLLPELPQTGGENADR